MIGEGRLDGSKKWKWQNMIGLIGLYIFLRRRRWCRESARDRSVVRKMQMHSKAIPLEMKKAFPVRKKKRRQAILIDPFPDKMKMKALPNKSKQTTQHKTLEANPLNPNKKAVSLASGKE